MAAILSSLMALAVAVPEGPKKDAPVAYRCDHLRMVRAQNEGVCDGNVVVKQGDLLLCCEKLTGTANADGAWQSFVCEGDVRGAQGNLLVWAGRARFDAKTNRLKLTNAPRAKRGQSTLWGKSMTIATSNGALDVQEPRGHLLPQASAASVADPIAPLNAALAPLPAQCPLAAGPNEKAPLP